MTTSFPQAVIQDGGAGVEPQCPTTDAAVFATGRPQACKKLCGRNVL